MKRQSPSDSSPKAAIAKIVARNAVRSVTTVSKPVLIMSVLVLSVLVRSSIFAYRSDTMQRLWGANDVVQGSSAAKNESTDTQTQSKTNSANTIEPTNKQDSSSGAANKNNDSTPESNSSAQAKSTAGSAARESSMASFTTHITKNGQVAVGTMIAYNATKKEKTFYGGDLAANPSSSAYSTMTGGSITVTTSSPDGRSVSMPSQPWDDVSEYFSVGTMNSNESATSHTLTITPKGLVSAGTYTVHIVSSRTEQSNDAWQYHAFLTIVVD